MSVLTDTERRTEAKSDAGAKFDRESEQTAGAQSTDPVCLDESC